MTAPCFTVYCHINRVNGKRYVGQTVYSMEKRWKDHVSLSKSDFNHCRAFANAIRKHGVDAFDHQVLEIVSTQEEADLAEAKWINQLTCRAPNGYNLKLGGGGHGHHQETKKLIGTSLRARNQKMTAEERLSKFGESLRAWWKRMTPEERAAARCTRSEKYRARWQKLTKEERSARQVARQRAVPSEKRSATVVKSWETRRAKYGQDGHRAKPPEVYGEAIKKGWANMSPEARTERVRKIKEGVRRAKESRSPRLVQINLLSPQIK